MKKILFLLIGLMLVSLVSATIMPEPFKAIIRYNGIPVNGLSVKLSCGTESVTKLTNSQGGVMVDLSAGSPDFNSCTSILTVDCGYPECYGTFNVASLVTPYLVSYELSEQPVTPVIPEPTVEDKVTSDGKTASVEAYYGECIDIVITDTKLSKLIDEQIDFDTEDYDVHEEIRVKAKIATSFDNIDYGFVPYVEIGEGDISYLYVFDDALPLSEIADDEELEIVFLGVPLEIVKHTGSSITIRYGEEKDVNEGETIDGVTVNVINDNYVSVSYNGESAKIYEGEVDEVGGIEIMVSEVVVNEDGTDICTLRIAEDVEITVKNGDDFEDGDIWRWIVTPNSIGIENQQVYDDLDDDDGYFPLAVGDKLVLPNDFTNIKFDSITKPNENEISIKIKDSYLKATGSFSTGSEDYDTIYVGDTGVLDKDLVLIGNEVRIGDSDIYLKKGSIIISKLKILSNLADILYDGVSYALKDEDYLDYLGIKFSDAEGSVQDKDTFNIVIPDERPEAKITVGEELAPSEPVEPIEPVCPDVACPETECPTTACPSCPDTSCPTCEECPEIPPDVNNWLVTGIIGIVALLGGAIISKKVLTKTDQASIETQIANKLSVGSGVRFYKHTDGKVRIRHLHYGRTGWHDPQTNHLNKKHLPGQLIV